MIQTILWTDYWVWGINPEPWRTPGFTHRGKRIVPVKDGKTEAFQLALKDEVVEQNAVKLHEGELMIEFYFWRSTAHNQPCDVTNIQKACEDALQDVLYVNDKHNRRVSSMLCEQSPLAEPAILIRIADWNPKLVPTLLQRPEVIDAQTWQPPETELF